MKRHQTLATCLPALLAGIIISRDGVKVTLVRGKTSEPLEKGSLLDGVPAALYEVDDTILVRVLPKLNQERRGIVSPWAPLPTDLLAADWCIHTVEEQPPAPQGAEASVADSPPDTTPAPTTETPPEAT
jgi:hypothetical protein